MWSDQEDYLSNFNREQLLQSYREGKRWFAAEYQRVDSGGSIHWVQYILRLEEAPITHQVYLFLYLARVDARHAMERAVRGNVQRDAASQLYDQETIQRIAEALFAERNGGNRAVAVFQIRGLKESAQSAGVSPEQVRREIAGTLSLALGENGILGQYSADQIVILFPDIAMQEELRRQIEETVAFLRRVLFSGQACHALRFVTGVVMLSAAVANYRSMLVQAMHTCSLWLDSVSDTVAFAQESDDWGRLQMLPSEGLDRVFVRTAEMARPLSEQEKDVAFDCVSAMLTARSLDDSLIGVLKTIGIYYHADRVYLLSLVENQRAVVMNFEWTSPSKRSIQQAVSGRRLDRFPLLERCLAERAPVFLIRRNPDAPRKGDAPGQPWYFTAIPLIREQKGTGFLCIENAREHPADAALFSKLIPYLLLEKDRFQEELPVAGSVQHLMGSPDRRAYLRAVPTLTWEQFSSLGVVCLDVPGLIAINSSYGFEYSVHLLWYVAKTLTEIFPPSWIFRTGEAEFILFLPNTTREVFLGRCGRLSSILQRRYPRQIRIGRAWSDGKFLGKDLVKKAKGARQMEPAALSANTWQPAAGGGTCLRAGKNQTMRSRFTVYLQPKINMRTGDLAGAEALVRGIGVDGSIIPPVQFIDVMEADGAIRDLDLLVLEQTLAQAEQWRADGLGTVPVSVNLSRVTVTHPSTLASVLAVQSRYPDFPSQALELEITERGDEVGNTEIQKIVEQFHSCALRLALDDFGSQYANLPLFATAKFDTVKLDKDLIADVVSNPINRTLVQDIIHICQTYGMTCVAEGVETSAQVDVLLDMGCIYAQGFYYDRPMPMEEFAWKYLRAGGPGAQNEQDKEEDI